MMKGLSIQKPSFTGFIISEIGYYRSRNLWNNRSDTLLGPIVLFLIALSCLERGLQTLPMLLFNQTAIYFELSNNACKMVRINEIIASGLKAVWLMLVEKTISSLPFLILHPSNTFSASLIPTRCCQVLLLFEFVKSYVKIPSIPVFLCCDPDEPVRFIHVLLVTPTSSQN